MQRRAALPHRAGLIPALHIRFLLIPALSLALTACGNDNAATTAPLGDCPVTPVIVIVSVDQWHDIVEALGGDCASVVTVVSGTSGDPHDYEPTPADTTKFGSARLVVINGLGYDEWARKAVDALDDRPALIDVGEVMQMTDGDNPHLWYSPDAVQQLGDAVTAELTRLAPDAAAYFDQQAAMWAETKQPYLDAISRIAAISGTAVSDAASSDTAPAKPPTYAATEPVFDYMAEAVGMPNVTPKGFQTASASGADPAPADIAAFNEVLEGGRATVLVYNTQTEGSAPAGIRKVAESSKVAVVEVTETVPPGGGGFIEWQVGQLDQLRAALQRARLAE